VADKTGGPAGGQTAGGQTGPSSRAPAESPTPAADVQRHPDAQEPVIAAVTTSPPADADTAGPAPATDIQRHLDRWEPVIAAVARVASSGGQPDRDLDGYLTQTAAFPNLAALAAALRRILAGDRDPAALTADLDPIGTAVIQTTLARLDPAEPPPPPSTAQTR
jgi:hypothetical protein